MTQFAPEGRFKLLLSADGCRYKPLATSIISGWKLKPFLTQHGITSVFGSKIEPFAACGRRELGRLHAKKNELSIRIEDDMNWEFGIEIEGDNDEFQEDELSCFRGLVLDISYRPINVVCWKRAICLEFMAKADVLEYYDQTVNSPNGAFNIPAVLRVPHLLQVVKRRRVSISISRKNIFYRDKYTCQYCSSGENLTIDHVIPSVQGGSWSWENLVTACSKCNGTKGARTPEEASMTLLKQPKAPNDYEIHAIPLTSAAVRMLRRRKGTPDEWQQYLSPDP